MGKNPSQSIHFNL